ncbi:MAG: hypothetical protein IPK07_16695 [Deltaproteobacteria bacterium]|jgi:glycerophosphoryl diester phosphodiesterase|nr:hypothetical protein [Deltaproteobacteria bacterium]
MKIWAHRGSSLIWPENTALAFRLAHEAGATGFETDLRLSADGEIMLAHDASLTRFGVEGVSIARAASRELEQIAIPSPDGRHRDRLMRLETLLATYPDKDYIFDCKIDDEALFEALAALLVRHPLREPPWFLTWSADADRRVAERFPGSPVFAREVATRRWGYASLLGLGRLAEPPNPILSLPVLYYGLPVVSKGQVRSLAARGKRFIGFLVDTEADIARARELGLMGVLTDRPDRYASAR